MSAYRYFLCVLWATSQPKRGPARRAGRAALAVILAADAHLYRKGIRHEENWLELSPEVCVWGGSYHGRSSVKEALFFSQESGDG